MIQNTKPALGNAGSISNKRFTFGKDTNYFQLYPESVSPIIENLSPIIPGYSKDRMYQIISAICIHATRRDETKKGFAPLKMEYLRHLVPQAEHYMKLLIDLGIVEYRKNSRDNISCNLFRIHSRYWCKLKGRAVNDAAFLLRIKKHQHKMRKHNSRRFPNQNECIRQLTISRQALFYIENIRETDVYNYYISAYYRIKNRDFYYTVDPTSQRFHSNLTNLPSNIRKYVRINGKPLANVDVKNCQPYLLAGVLKNPAKAAPFAVNNKFFKHLLRTLAVNQTEDIARFTHLVTTGQLYEYLLEQFTMHGVKNLDRDKVKRQVLKILFDRNSNTSKIKKIFASLFPELDRVLRILRGDERGNKFTKYSRLAILLQRLESHIVLEKALKRINTENPNIIAVTIHDSIMTEILFSHTQSVKTVLEEEFFRFFGLNALLKIENKGIIEISKEKVKD